MILKPKSNPAVKSNQPAFDMVRNACTLPLAVMSQMLTACAALEGHGMVPAHLCCFAHYDVST